MLTDCSEKSAGTPVEMSEYKDITIYLLLILWLLNFPEQIRF